MFNVQLYIMMFSNIPDLTPGKAAAQAAHASSMCTLAGETLINLSKTQTISKSDYTKIWLYEEWKSSTKDGFGTTMIFRSNCNILEQYDDYGYNTELTLFVDEVPDTLYGYVLDPTYPYINTSNMKTDYMSIFTCAWFLVDKKDLKNLAALDIINLTRPLTLF